MQLPGHSPPEVRLGFSGPSRGTAVDDCGPDVLTDGRKDLPTRTPCGARALTKPQLKIPLSGLEGGGAAARVEPTEKS